jgi:NADH-quinone oxidoreductase subunit N
MMQHLETIILLFPELVLLLGAFGIVLHSVFAKADRDYIPSPVRYGFLILLLAALGSGWNLLSSPKLLLGQWLVHSRFLLVVKTFTILLSFFFWGMRRSVLYEAFGRARLHFYEYTALIFLSLFGTFMLISSNHWLGAYLGLEMQVIPWYIILAYRHEQLRAIESGIKYFIFGSIASALFLYGLAFVFGSTGSLTLTAIPLTTWGLVGAACILAGLFLKLAVAPFHVWVMEVYEGADNVQVAYLSTIPMVTFLVFLIRVLKGPFLPMTELMENILRIAACISIFIGALGALKQQNIRKLLAYGGLAHMGLVFLVIATMPSVALFYIFFYATTTMALYLGISMIYRSTSNLDLLRDLNGIGVLYPLLAFSLSLCILSLAGIPPLPGFWAKFSIFLALIEKEQYGLLAIGALGTVVSFYYYLQLIRHIYFMPEEIERPQSEIYGHAYLRNAILLFIILFFLGLDKIQTFLEGLSL